MIEWFPPLLLALFFGILAWRRMDWAVALVLFLTPAYQLRFHIGFLPLTYLEVMLIVLVAVWALLRVLRKDWRTLQWPWKWLTLFFVLAGVVAVVVSPDTRAALGLWKAYIFEPVLFFYVFVNVLRTPRQWRLALVALGALVVIVGFGALLQYAGLVPGVEPYALELPMRATSVFSFPTAIGKLIGPLVALFLGLLLVSRHKSLELRAQSLEPERKTTTLLGVDSRRIFFVGVVAFGLIGLILSVSRGALVGIAAAVVFISFFSSWKKWLWALCVLGILAVAFVPQLRAELTSIISGSDVSTDVHVVMWKGTLRLIADRPIFGAGLAGFPIVYADYKEASHTEFFPSPDHLLLTLWVEMGLAGLVVFGWIVVRYFVAGFRSLYAIRYTPLANGKWLMANGEFRALIAGLLAAMVELIVHGFFDTPYFKNDLAVIFWALVGMVVILNQQILTRSVR